MYYCVDVAGSRTVGFKEFLMMISRAQARCDQRPARHRKRAEEEDMRTAFKVFDIDGNGFIDAHELRLTMAGLGETLSDQDVEAMIRSADRNGDGKIDYEGRWSTTGAGVLTHTAQSPRNSQVFFVFHVTCCMTEANLHNFIHPHFIIIHISLYS